MKDLIKSNALESGFSHCGIARIGKLDEIRPRYAAFLQRNGHASMKYLETYFEKRMNPELVMAGTRSVITVLLNYYPPEIIAEEDNYVISKYAYGRDYHLEMRERMAKLVGIMKDQFGEFSAKAFVDSGPVLEKAWAQRCGVGWQGKNTLIINKTGGSFFFIGIILTDLDLEPDLPESDHCGTCNACVTACPTGALDMPYQLNIVRCISYQTIENREEIPSMISERLNGRIYGCDACQDVCPYNRFARPHNIPGFLPSDRLKKMRKQDWTCLDEPGFSDLFAESGVKRVGYERFIRGIRPNDIRARQTPPPTTPCQPPS